MSDIVTLREFKDVILSAWRDDKSPACTAASEALYAATVACVDKPKGTILVVVPDAAAVKAVVAYLSAFLTDQEHLSRLCHKVGTDEVMVAGLRILVLPHNTTRRPRNVLQRIVVADSVTATSELPSDFEIARCILHCLAWEVRGYNTPGKLSEPAHRLFKLLSGEGEVSDDPREAFVQLMAKFDAERERYREEREAEFERKYGSTAAPGSTITEFRQYMSGQVKKVR